MCHWLRASEVLALRWGDVLWEQAKIAVSKRWSRGKDGPTKTRKSEGHVPLHPALAYRLKEWRIQTTLDLYAQGDGDETRAAQGAFLKEMGMATEMIQ